MGTHAMEGDRPNVAIPVAAGAAAALLGGLVWAAIVKYTQYEIGIAAWGIGVLVGLAIVYFSRGHRDITMQVIGVLLALGGVVLGKYLSWAWWGKDNGYAAFSDWWSFWDALWIGLAVISAWRIIQPDEVEPELAATPGTPAERSPIDDRTTGQ